MKKLLSFLTLLTLSIGVSWAANTTVTFTFSSLYTSNTVLDGVSIDGTDVSLVFNKRDGGTATQYYSYGEAVRWYGGGTLTVSSTTKTITRIEIVYTKHDNSVSASVGSYSDISGSSGTGTWSGSASSVVFTQSGTKDQARITSVQVTYTDGGSTVETVATPTFSPAEGTFTEAQNVTIACTTDGATIYYTTDGSTPTTSSSVYSSAIPVSSTTTIKAIAVKDGMNNSSVASATYTINIPPVTPATGDFVLVTSADQLVAGNEYIIMTKDPDGYTLAMGDLNSSNKGSWTQEFAINGTVGAEGSTVSVYSESTTSNSLVNILELENTNGQLALKQQSAGTYLNITANSTDITGSASKTYLTIEIGSDYFATIKGYSTRQILFYITSDVFGNYSSSNANGSSYSKVYLYTRGALQPPVFTPAGGIYGIDVDVTISCPTTGATIYYTTDGTDPTTSSTQYTGEILVRETTTFKAIAVKDGETSRVTTATYTITPNTNPETVTLTYSEPFTEGVGKFIVENISGFSPVWTLDGNYGIKGTSYSNGTNYAAVSRFLSPYVDMTNAVQPALTFSHQINSFFDDVTNQCELYIREVENGTPESWTKLSVSFSTPSSGNWTNDVASIDLSDYAGKTVQVSFLYTNTSTTSGAGTWEIQNFRMYDASDVIYVNNIAEFLALDENTTATFRNPVTVLYDYAQNSNSSYQEYIWFKDESGYSQFYLLPTLNSTYDEDTETYSYSTRAKYENGDIIPAGFTVVKNYYAYGAYLQAFSNDALNAGFQTSTQKGLADPEYFDYSTINNLTAADTTTYCNRYITLEKIRILSKSGKYFYFSDENSTTACKTVGYNKFSDESSLKKNGSTAVVNVPDASTSTYYNVKAILQVWKGQNNAVTWEILPIEFTEWSAEEVTLRKLCADGVEQNNYTISNNLLGVYASADGTKLWVKDDTGQSIWETEPSATWKDNFAIEFEGDDGIPANTRMEQANYDQSNWCELHLTSGNAASFVNKIISGGSIEGKFTDKLNPTMENVSLSLDDIYSESSYALNYYIPANFLGSQSCHTDMHGQEGHGDYFFMNPKPQEVVEIVWAIWDSEHQVFMMSTDPIRNTHQFEGEFTINPEMNIRTDVSITDGYGYNFKAIIRKTASGLRDVNGGNYEVYPLDLDEGIDPATAIESITAGNGEVKSVKYVNVAGMVSDTPFQGVNIVVTEYTDGTRTATKMLKR